jgi:hypothetical protein
MSTNKPATRKPSTRKPATRKQSRMSDKKILEKTLREVSIQKPSESTVVKLYKNLDEVTQKKLLKNNNISPSEVSTTQKLKNTLRRNTKFFIAIVVLATSCVLLYLARQHKIINEQTLQQVVNEFNSLGNKWWKYFKSLPTIDISIILNSANSFTAEVVKLITKTVKKRDAPPQSTVKKRDAPPQSTVKKRDAPPPQSKPEDAPNFYIYGNPIPLEQSKPSDAPNQVALINQVSSSFNEVNDNSEVEVDKTDDSRFSYYTNDPPSDDASNGATWFKNLLKSDT